MKDKLTGYLQKYNFGKDSHVWNPWRGCTKISEGCANCYIRRSFCCEYRPFPYAEALPGTIITVSLLSDFFLKNADGLREQVWQEIKAHPNLIFLIITKRVSRIQRCLPKDWGEGYDNVILCATAENQKNTVSFGDGVFCAYNRFC